MDAISHHDEYVNFWFGYLLWLCPVIGPHNTVIFIEPIFPWWCGEDAGSGIFWKIPLLNAWLPHEPYNVAVAPPSRKKWVNNSPLGIVPEINYRSLRYISGCNSRAASRQFNYISFSPINLRFVATACCCLSNLPLNKSCGCRIMVLCNSPTNGLLSNTSLAILREKLIGWHWKTNLQRPLVRRCSATKINSFRPQRFHIDRLAEGSKGEPLFLVREYFKFIALDIQRITWICCASILIGIQLWIN